MKMLKKSIILAAVVLLASKAALFADIDDTVRKEIPAKYYSRCDLEGETNLLQYKTPRMMRSAIVYTPYGYNPEDKETRYPVLYLMHGGGGSSTNYLGPAKCPNSLCWIIDNAIQNGDIQPLIIVCPSDNGAFFSELRNQLIPAVDEAYNTIADRDHRAFGGFSMGSVATWNVYMHDLDIVKNYIPMSGDSWVCGSTGGKTFPEQTAQALTKAQYIDEYKDFKIFAATGMRDSAYPNLTPQIAAMKNVTDYFQYTTGNFDNGNLIYYVAPANMHSYNHTYEYIYNALMLFFPD